MLSRSSETFFFECETRRLNQVRGRVFAVVFRGMPLGRSGSVPQAAGWAGRGWTGRHRQDNKQLQPNVTRPRRGGAVAVEKGLSSHSVSLTQSHSVSLLLPAGPGRGDTATLRHCRCSGQQQRGALITPGRSSARGWVCGRGGGALLECVLPSSASGKFS